jgi:hypothetical protein
MSPWPRIAMPVLTEQFGAWLKSGQWNAGPLSMVLTRMGYSPHFDGTLTPAVINWLLSYETAFVVVVAASAFGCALWKFETARSLSIHAVHGGAVALRARRRIERTVQTTSAMR